jgi:hypothetical protein
MILNISTQQTWTVARHSIFWNIDECSDLEEPKEIHLFEILMIDCFSGIYLALHNTNCDYISYWLTKRLGKVVVISCMFELPTVLARLTKCLCHSKRHCY